MDQKVDQIAASSVRYAVTSNAAGYSGILTPITPITFIENEKKNESLVIVQSGG